MTRKLRSNFPRGSYLWAVRNAQWHGMGLPEADCEKPKIAIVNSSSGLAACFAHLDAIVPVLKEAIRAAGGVPLEVRTAAPSDFVIGAGGRGGYILAARDLVTNDIEVAVEGALLDGMVCLASCDKTTPGQIMAAGRLNIPTIVVVCGYQKAGSYRGQHTDIEDVFLKTGYLTSGAVTLEEVKGMADVAIQSPGVCQGMGTANSMHVVCEALGMTLPGSAPVAAGSAKMHENLRASGARIVEMVWQDLKPRDVITPGAVRNAVQMVLAVSGSINCVKHLQAIATEAEAEVDVYQTFADYAERVPLLAAVKPTGTGHIEDFEAAGGARAVLKRLERQLDLDARSVSGQTLREVLAATTVADERAIATLDKPLSKRPSIVIVRGSLLPGGGIVRLGGTGERMLEFKGKANIFHSRDEALAGIKAGKVKPGDVVVLRGLGVIGGPGMAMTSAVIFALDGAGLLDRVAAITEGQLSGLVNNGLVVGEASPEAAAGGPLAFVENGDIISIDVKRKTVDLEVPEAVLAERRKTARVYGAQDQRGWLGVYQRTVVPVHEGAVLKGR